ncbi:MFS transporter [Cellulomonas sp. ES6]|uniref:MFS transporter n=1 Tax=Cellulomonas sp. ES6 TaxID=3039384 RepID=UPI0024B82DA1|nr:MFS transporter [Cellulomonas sp. ES6]WHP16147.1 MFS transporter [Cellulomonas sp. ES6]
MAESTPATQVATTGGGSPAGADGTATPLSRPRLWAVLGLVLLADALDMIDSTVTNIAAPSIVADIGGGDGLIKWLGASYALALGVLLVIGGRLGDKYGQRRLFLLGMTGFVLASGAAGLATGPGVMVAARLLQGAFGALLIPQGMAIMTRAFPRDMMRTAFGLFGPLLGIAAIGGPVLAGFLIDADVAGTGWRAVFLINIVLGVVGVPLSVRLLPRDGDTSAERAAVSIDGQGSAYLALSMFGLLYGLIEGSQTDWAPVSLAALAVGVIAFVLFVRRQRTAADPLLRPSLFANRGFTAGLIMGLAFFAATSGLMYVLSLFLQGGLHQSPGRAALSLMPLTVGIMVAAFACMGLMARLGRTLVFAGLTITLVGLGWFLLLVLAQGLSIGTWAMVAPVFVMGVGLGTCFGTIYDIALGDVSAEEAGSASGSLTAVQQLANGIGSALITTVYLHALGGGSGGDASGGTVHAVTVALLIALVITAVCLPVARLLPRRAQAEPDHG